MLDFSERDGRFSLTSTALCIDFDTARRRFSIGQPDAPPALRDATARARFATLVLDTSALKVASVEQQSIDDIHGPGARLSVAFQPEAGVGLTFHACLYQSHPFASFRLIAANRSAQTLTLRQLTPLRTPPGALQLGSAPSRLAFFKNGYQSWSYAGVLRADQPDVDTRLGGLMRRMHYNLTTPIERGRGRFWSEMFGALIDPGARKAMIAGQIGAADQFAQVFADTRPGQVALTLTCDLDEVPLAAGQPAASEEMFVQLIDLPVDDPFADYFDAVARHMRPRAQVMPNAGWCSWYDYFSRVREDDVMANLRTASEWRPTLPIDVIQIDDGYQTKTGDWLSANAKFPHGLQWLAGQIRQAGHTPGLWLAPFIATKSSQVAQQHADWLISNAEGKPISVARNWGERTYGLDLTHPGAQDYIRHVVHTAVHEWGYPYLKLDFLAAGAILGRRRDPALTRAQVLRRGLALIRETAGEETFLLGCGCPLGQAIGIVDAMRIGADIAPDEPSWLPRFKGVSLIFSGEADWPSQRNAVRNVLTRSSMHRRKWWINDPDTVIVRPTRHVSEVETRSWVSLVGLSGGLVMLGDDLTGLPPDRRRYIAPLLPPPGASAFALDLFERERPELYVLRQDGEWGSGVVAGVFNWEDRPRRKSIDLARLGLDPLKPHHVFEFWSGEYQRIEMGQVDLGELPAHGCAVLAIRPVLDRPHLVATTFHLTMGGEIEKFEVRNTGLEVGSWRLEIGVRLNRRATGEIWIAGGTLHEARKDGQSIAVRQPAPEVWALPLEVSGTARIQLRGDSSLRDSSLRSE